jgi:hypothetical protein
MVSSYLNRFYKLMAPGYFFNVNQDYYAFFKSEFFQSKY